MKEFPIEKQPFKTNILRRLASMFYDALLIIALWMTVSGIAVSVNHGQAIPAGQHWFSLLLLGITYAYFVGSWLFYRQTIGMKAWRLFLQHSDDKKIDLWRCSKRFAAAIPSLLLGGIGFWWMLIDKKRLAWHDRSSNTFLRYIPKCDAKNKTPQKKK